MAEPRYHFQEAPCRGVVLTWLPPQVHQDDITREAEQVHLAPFTGPPPPLRPHVHNRPRDVQRNHRERAVRHATEVARTVRHIPEDDVPRLARLWADNLQACSCAMCGNPRRWFGKRTVQELRLAAREADDLAELVPPTYAEMLHQWWDRAWYHDDYPDGPHQWPPLCDQCPVVECWEVAGGEACRQAILRQERLDLAPEDDDMEEYRELMHRADRPSEWPPPVPAICETCETPGCYRHCSREAGICERCQTDRAHPGGFCSRVPSMRVDYDD